MADSEPAADRDTALRYESSVAFGCALIALGLAASMIWGTRDFALDDAWIHLDYAKSLRAGDGLSYNPGDHETGFSSPLWVLLLSVWPIAGNPVIPVKLLGALLHAVTAWAGALLTLELGRERAGDEHPLPLASMTVLGGVLVACVPTSVQAATSGMEVTLATAVLLTGLREVLRGRWAPALILGVLAPWARPELLFAAVAFGGTMAATLWTQRRDDPRWRAALALPAGAAVGLGLWVAYCLAVSGAPWPNAQYIKGIGGGLAGLGYLRDEVLVWQPWLVSLGGAGLLAFALRDDARARRGSGFAIVLACVVTWVAIALSRPLHPGVQFFEARYFAIVAPLPVVLIPLGVGLAFRPDRARWVRWLALAALVPVAGLSGLQIDQLRDALVEHTEDTFVLHTQPAQVLAERLPADAVVGVEGAGAHRFFTPRTMTIVDLIGLNNAEAARVHFDRQAKLCTFVRRDLTHLLVPLDWLPQFSPPFAVRVLERFDDPSYSQVRPAHPMSVVLVEVGGVAPDWAARCG
ncbi:MAG: hypothetical protein AAGA54_05925 [Myxococcota bacterium]